MATHTVKLSGGGHIACTASDKGVLMVLNGCARSGAVQVGDLTPNEAQSLALAIEMAREDHEADPASISRITLMVAA